MADDDRLTRLIDLRDRLTAALSEAAPRELAPLAKQLRDTRAEIEAMPVAKESTPVDDIAAARAARRARATGS